jgi:hypothetical protein
VSFAGRRGLDQVPDSRGLGLHQARSKHERLIQFLHRVLKPLLNDEFPLIGSCLHIGERAEISSLALNR